MKKFFMIAFALILALAVLSGCSNSEEPGTLPEEISEEIPEGNWDRDAFEHWQSGENGEKLNAAEHSIGDDWVCTVCKSEVIDWGDGSYDVMNYDENYNTIRQTIYATDGSATDYTHEYEYDENGNILFIKGYENGRICLEEEHVINSEGISVIAGSTVYFTSGYKEICGYNENGDIIKQEAYKEDGTLYYHITREYALDDDGYSYLFKLNEIDEVEETEHEYVYNEQGDCLSYTEYDFYKMVLYTETAEYEYNEEGWTIYKKVTVNGLPSEEIHYGIFDDGEGGRWTYHEKHIYYYEDGSYTVVEHDENDEIINETSFDANGNEI